MNPEKYYTTGTLAAEIGYTDRRIRQMCVTGGIKGIKLSGKWLIPRTEVDRLSREGWKAPEHAVHVVVVHRVRQPASPLQQKLYDRCQLLSEDYPEGDHDWMDDGRNEGVGFSVQTGQGPESTIAWVDKFCWFCEHVQRAKPKIPAGAGIEGLFPR